MQKKTKNEQIECRYLRRRKYCDNSNNYNLICRYSEENCPFVVANKALPDDEEEYWQNTEESVTFK